MSFRFKLLNLLPILILSGCTINSKPATVSDLSNQYLGQSSSNSYSRISQQVLDNASQFIGTPYRYGGMSKKGIDCSALVYLAFSEADIKLPRVSRQQAKAGVTIPPSQARPGDLIFFHTDPHSRAISHVGIVDKVDSKEILFLHASTSRGVKISSSQNVYWKPRIVKFVRVIHP